MLYRELIPGDLWLSYNNKDGYLLVSVCNATDTSPKGDLPDMIKFTWLTMWTWVSHSLAQGVFDEFINVDEPIPQWVTIIRDGRDVQAPKPPRAGRPNPVQG